MKTRLHMMLPTLLWLTVQGCASRGETKVPEDPPETPTDFDVAPGGVVTEVSAVVHEEVKTILIVRWTQSVETVSTHIVFTFENGEWFETPAAPRTEGSHQEVLLGVPEQTPVTFYIETEVETEEMDAGDPDGRIPDGGVAESERFIASTGDLPSIIPRPTVLDYRADIAGAQRFLLAGVEDTQSQNRYYTGPFWIVIIDRRGRIVWYFSDLGSNPVMAYPRLARDNSHLYIEKRKFYAPGSYDPEVVRLTLDHRRVEAIPMPALDDCIDVTNDGGILYNHWARNGDAGLRERRPDGSVRDIWNCRQWALDSGAADLHENYCYSNTVNWNPLEDTVLMSMPYINTAVEIDRPTGRLLSVWGDLATSYTFEPSTWTLEFNHFPNITPDGTLLISTHAPGHEDKDVVGEHRIVEFEIDRANRTLVEKWVYGEGFDDWPKAKGEAQRLENGNTLVNYGTGGVIREVTPDKRTAWHVKWDADFEDDTLNKMVGHTIFLDDLYGLCRGW